MRALVLTGSVERPTGVFRGHGGTVTVSSVTDNVIRGSYRIDATGFVTTRPDDEAVRSARRGPSAALRD